MTLVSESELYEFEQFGNVGFMGPTNSGKTFAMKRFFCDKKLPLYDLFIYVGNVKELQEIRNAYAAHLYLHGKDWKKGNMMFFNRQQLQQALAYCESSENATKSKLIFLDDALINKESKGNVKKDIGNFMHQSKNSNTTVFISIHIPMGGAEEKMIRASLRYLILLNEEVNTITRLTDLDPKGTILKNYELASKYDKFLIYDKTDHLLFGKDYTIVNGVKNYQNNIESSSKTLLNNNNEAETKEPTKETSRNFRASTPYNDYAYENNDLLTPNISGSDVI